MPTIIGKKGKLVPTRGHADEQIKVAGDFSHRPEPPAFLAEQPGDLLVHAEDRHVLQEIK